MRRSGTDHPVSDDGDGGAVAPVMTPSTARRRLGEALKQARDAAHLTLDQAAEKIERSAPTLSRLENGKSTPRLVDVKALIDHYAEQSPSAIPNGTRKRIIQLAQAGRAEEWFTPFRDVISSDMTADDIQRYVEFETDATEIRTFQPNLVPGLLQTPGYATAVTELFFPSRTRDERERFVAFRIARQRVLQRTTGAVQFHAVIDESVLRKGIGSPDVTREQLTALLDVSRNGIARPNVRVQIAPVGLTVRAVLGGPFTLLSFGTPDEPDLAYLEGPAGAQYNQTTPATTRYRELFQELSDALPDASESQSLLEGAIKALD